VRPVLVSGARRRRVKTVNQLSQSEAQPSRTGTFMELNMDKLTWRSPITPANKNLADAVLKMIGPRLLNPNILWEAKRRCIANLPQFQFGCSGELGLALFAGCCDFSTAGLGFDAIAREHLGSAIGGNQHLLHQMPISVGEGLCGVGITATFLANNETRYSNLLKTIEATVNARVLAFLSQLINARDWSLLHPYDFVSGLSGVGAFLVQRHRKGREQQALIPILKSLVFLAGHDHGVSRLSTPPKLLGEVYSKHDEFRHGLINLGLAHGVPGPLAVLSVARIAGIEVAGMPEAIENLAEFMMQNCATDEFGFKWPAAIALDEHGRSQSPSTWGRTAWCYGNPGVSRALWLAGIAIDSVRVCDFALDTMLSSLERYIAENDLVNPTFCHGVAGLLQIVLRFYHDKPTDILAHWADRLASLTTSLYREEFLLGFKGFVRNKGFDDPRLFQGVTGVALALVAATSDIEPSWDSLFMLS
jgi:lantibiotic biosynthesis protein